MRLQVPSQQPLSPRRSGITPGRSPGLPTRLPSGHAVGARARPLTKRGRALGGRGVPLPAGRSGGASVLPPVRHAAAHATVASDWSQAPAGPLKAPPPADGQAGRAWRRRAGPPSCQLRGRPGRRAGGRSLATSSLARARSLSPPVGKSGPPERLPPPPRPDLLPGPFPAQSFPPAHPRVVSGPA